MARSRAAADRQDDDRGIETRNPAHQPSGRLPGSLHQCYCPGHSPRCQSRRVCATTCVIVRSFGGGDGARAARSTPIPLLVPDSQAELGRSGCSVSQGPCGGSTFLLQRTGSFIASQKMVAFAGLKTGTDGGAMRAAMSRPGCSYTNCRQGSAISTFTASGGHATRVDRGHREGEFATMMPAARVAALRAESLSFTIAPTYPPYLLRQGCLRGGDRCSG